MTYGDAPGEMAALGVVNLNTLGNIPTTITAGLDITCAKLNSTPTTTKCWGQNAAGQIALQAGTNVAPSDIIGNNSGEMGDPLTPVSLGAGTTISASSAGYDFICHIRNDGKLYCFGDNNYGRMALGQPAHTGDDADEMGSFLTKVNLGTGLVASKVAVGYQHACAIVTTGQVKCWGRNQFGQLGLEDTVNRNTQPQMGDALPFVNLGSGRTAKEIATGYYHTCAILDNDLVKCWGRNQCGQLGYGNTTTRGNNSTSGAMGNSLGYVDLGTSKTAKQIALGSDFSCAILNDDRIKCWGLATNGPLGKGSNTAHLGDGAGEMGDSLTNIATTGSLTVSSMAVGTQHVCVILSDSTVHCWGNGGNGRLGYDATGTLGNAGGQMPTAAVNLGAGRTAKKIAAGGSHTCAILDNDTIKCWGNGNNGRLGQGSTTAWGSNNTTASMTNLNAVICQQDLRPNKSRQ